VQARRFAVFTAGAATLLLASSQLACSADVSLLRKAPLAAPTAPASWAGFYLGGELGFDAAAAKYERPLGAQDDISIGSVNRGLVWGAYAGYNYQALPWLVLGIEGAWSTSRAGYRELGAEIDFLQDSKFVGSVAGRLGLVIMPTTMVYAKGGPAWIDVRGVEGFGTDFSTTLQAAMFGVGVESMITPNVLVRLEGTYTRATETLTLNDGGDLYTPDILQVMVGAAYKFDIPGLTAPMASPRRPLLTKAPLLAKAPAAAATDWTGIEVGGFVSVNDDQMQYFGSNSGENDEQGPYANFKVGGGAFVDFDGQFSKLVLGVEASANFQKADFNVAEAVGFPAIFHFASIDNVYALSFRAGWLVTPDTLLYAKVGPAWIRVTPDAGYFNAIASNPNTGTVTINGYQYGGGVETYLSQYFSVRVEGVYTASRVGINQLLFNGLQPSTPISLKPSLLSGTLGVAVHF
jgi:opacity protein-like surface antigen